MWIDRFFFSVLAQELMKLCWNVSVASCWVVRLRLQPRRHLLLWWEFLKTFFCCCSLVIFGSVFIRLLVFYASANGWIVNLAWNFCQLMSTNVVVDQILRATIDGDCTLDCWPWYIDVLGLKVVATGLRLRDMHDITCGHLLHLWVRSTPTIDLLGFGD